MLSTCGASKSKPRRVEGGAKVKRSAIACFDVPTVPRSKLLSLSIFGHYFPSLPEAQESPASTANSVPESRHECDQALVKSRQPLLLRRLLG
ncbi:hypothetical protein V496_08410 [Pseudogymnoascus sp. VKM F-4515 (FW-2607)]|nr:hypothetical protein V496_08410 [Pseudogymnoascus sp. VKM F-4515 (FW-2607)]